MRCKPSCVLELEGDDAPPLKDFLTQLRRCDDCPHASEAAEPVFRRLLERSREAARDDRRKRATIRKLEHEAREVQLEVDRYELTITKLERLQTVSSEQIEVALREQLERVLAQEREIEALSVPLIHIWDGVIVLPIIGTLSAARADVLTARLLDEVSTAQRHTVIIDVTGVRGIDTSTANHIIDMVAALRLLGAKPVLTGVTPDVAQTLVALGVELSEVTTLRSVRQALRMVMLDAVSS